MRSQQQEKLINADLMKSQRICHQMDSKAVRLSIYFCVNNIYKVTRQVNKKKLKIFL